MIDSRKVLYHAKATPRADVPVCRGSSDGRLEVKLSRLAARAPAPTRRQLFAAGWSACFDSAMEFAAPQHEDHTAADHAVDAEI